MTTHRGAKSQAWEGGGEKGKPFLEGKMGQQKQKLHSKHLSPNGWWDCNQSTPKRNQKANKKLPEQ